MSYKDVENLGKSKIIDHETRGEKIKIVHTAFIEKRFESNRSPIKPTTFMMKYKNVGQSRAKEKSHAYSTYY